MATRPKTITVDYYEVPQSARERAAFIWYRTPHNVRAAALLSVAMLAMAAVLDPALLMRPSLYAMIAVLVSILISG